MRTIAGANFCGCTLPKRQFAEGIELCGACGERLPDPLLLAVLAEVRALRDQVGGTAGAAAPPAMSRPLTTAEVAARLGRSMDWVRDNREELGLIPGKGEKPRLLFDPVRVAEYAKAPERQRSNGGPTPTPPRRRPSATANLLPVKGAP